MTLRSALLPLALVLGTMACDKDDTDDTEVGTDMGTDAGVDPTSITGIAAGDARFSILVDAAVRAGLDGVLAAPGTYTIFAPTNDAFEALFDAIPDVDSVDDLPVPSLTAILTYHGLTTEEFAADLGDLGGTVDTLSGFTMFVNAGDSVMVNQATVIEADIDASNGVIHAIDSVLLPPTMAQAAGLAGLTGLITAIEASSPGTQALFSAGPTDDPITVFAPNNAAFTAAADITAGFEAADFDAVLAYHAVAGAVASTAIPAIGSSLLTNSAGQNVSIVFDTTDGVFANDSEVILADIKVVGGTIHVVDSVLLPPTIVDLATYAGLSSLLDTVAIADADASNPMIGATLSGAGTFTVFAPTNGAFTAAAVATLSDAQIGTVLTYHVINGAAPILSTDLVAGTETTLQGEGVTIALDGGATVNGNAVVIADVVATNGVVHVIDGVLVPPSFLQ
jgi:transforming growth factor-beta-induced protein